MCTFDNTRDYILTKLLTTRNSLVYNEIVNHRKVINLWWFLSKITWLKPHFKFVIFRDGIPSETNRIPGRNVHNIYFFINDVSFSVSLFFINNYSTRLESMQKPTAWIMHEAEQHNIISFAFIVSCWNFHHVMNTVRHSTSVLKPQSLPCTRILKSHYTIIKKFRELYKVRLLVYSSRYILNVAFLCKLIDDLSSLKDLLKPILSEEQISWAMTRPA